MSWAIGLAERSADVLPRVKADPPASALRQASAPPIKALPPGAWSRETAPLRLLSWPATAQEDRRTALPRVGLLVIL